MLSERLIPIIIESMRGQHLGFWSYNWSAITCWVCRFLPTPEISFSFYYFWAHLSLIYFCDRRYASNKISTNSNLYISITNYRASTLMAGKKTNILSLRKTTKTRKFGSELDKYIIYRGKKSIKNFSQS